MAQLLMRSVLGSAAEPAASNINDSLYYPQRGQMDNREASAWTMGDTLRYAMRWVAAYETVYSRHTKTPAPLMFVHTWPSFMQFGVSVLYSIRK